MSDLIGLPQVATELGLSRMRAWELYKRGDLQAVTVIGTEGRPRPLFSKAYVAAVAKQRATKAEANR